MRRSFGIWSTLGIKALLMPWIQCSLIISGELFRFCFVWAARKSYYCWTTTRLRRRVTLNLLLCKRTHLRHASISKRPSDFLSNHVVILIRRRWQVSQAGAVLERNRSMTCLSKKGKGFSAHLDIQITFHIHVVIFREPFLNCLQLFTEGILHFNIGNLCWYVALYDCDGSKRASP